MTYRISSAARTDLVEIFVSGVEEFGVPLAEKYQTKIYKTIDLIGDNPKIARMRSETVPLVRIHPVGVHIIVYLVDDNSLVRILRVRHGRENWAENPIGAI